jgi:hypothetical protein
MNFLPILLETTDTGEIVIDDTWYSPGVVGFVATFGVAAVAVFIIFDMVRRIRRVRYRAEIGQLLDQEERANNTEAKKPVARSKPARPEPPAKPKRS